MTRRISALLPILCLTMTTAAQTLSLDSCRSMAVGNNRQLAATRIQGDIALNLKKAARTKYLPHVTAIGGYELTSRRISILSKAQQGMLNSIGTTMAGGMAGSMADCLTEFVTQGIITPEAAMKMQQTLGQQAGSLPRLATSMGRQ